MPSEITTQCLPKWPAVLLACACVLASCGSASVTTLSASKTSTVSPAPTGTVVLQPPPLLPTDPPVRGEGITNDSQAPFSQSDLRVSSQYHGPLGDRWISIYAGARSDASGAPLGGLIHVYSEPIAFPNETAWKDLGVFTVPNSPKWVSLLAVDGSMVTLRREDGTTVMFDMSKLTFK